MQIALNSGMAFYTEGRTTLNSGFGQCQPNKIWRQ